MQASQSWNIHFDEVIKASGFIQTFGDACIYKKVSGSSVPFLILYADAILLIGNDVEFPGKHKGVSERSFSKKYLGEATYILSIKIHRDRSRRFISFFNFIPCNTAKNSFFDCSIFELLQNIVKVCTH